MKNKNYNQLGFYSKLICFGEEIGMACDVVGPNISSPRKFNGMPGLIQHVKRRLKPGQNLRVEVEKYLVNNICKKSCVMGGTTYDFGGMWRGELQSRGIQMRWFIQFAHNAKAPILRHIVALCSRSYKILHRYAYSDSSPLVRSGLLFNPYAMPYMLTKLTDLVIHNPKAIKALPSYTMGHYSDNISGEIRQLILHRNIRRRDLFRLLRAYPDIAHTMFQNNNKITTSDVEKFASRSNQRVVRIAAFGSGKLRLGTFLQYMGDSDEQVRKAIIDNAPLSVLYKMFKTEQKSYLLYLILRRRGINLRKIPAAQYERALNMRNPAWQLLHCVIEFAAKRKLSKRLGMMALKILKRSTTNPTGLIVEAIRRLEAL